MESEVEYSFWHVLVRDAAYGQIPRGERARRHRGVGFAGPLRCRERGAGRGVRCGAMGLLRARRSLRANPELLEQRAGSIGPRAVAFDGEQVERGAYLRDRLLIASER
jgi:hypothetical protein